MSKSLLQQALEIQRNGGDVLAWYKRLTPEEQKRFLREVEVATNAMLAAFREFAVRVHGAVMAVVEALGPVLAEMANVAKALPRDADRSTD